LSESALYKRDLFIHRDLITWDKIGQWCLKATQDLDPTSHVVAAEAVCIYRAGDMVNSSRKIDDALAQTPRDPLVQAVYAYLLMKMNSMDKARVAAEKALDFDPQGKNTVTRALEATLCQQTRDYTCAKKYWAEVLSREPISLQAMMGMAESLYGEGQYDQSRQYLSRVLARNSNYIPGIKLKRQLEQVESKREF
jgi:Tfp pilus assembly protein PilF